jgi:hypothetical protein
VSAIPFATIFPPLAGPPAAAASSLTATITAMDDWYRLITFDFGSSFVEFSPPPPNVRPTIALANVYDPLGTIAGGILRTRIFAWPFGRRTVRGLHVRPAYDSWSPGPSIPPVPGGTALTLGAVTTNASTVTVPVGGGVAGSSYNLKCVVTLSTGVNLSIPLVYVVAAPGTSPITPATLTHLIDPTRPQTWMRDYVFDFAQYLELKGTSPPALTPGTFAIQAGATLVSQIASGTKIVARIYCTQAGAYNLRARVTLADTISTRLSLPGVLNAQMAGW